MSAHDMETTIQLPDEEDVDVYIVFEVTSWGSPGVGPSLNYSGDPPEPPEFELTKLVRLDNGEDITAKFDSLPDEFKTKVYELVFNHVCEIEQDRDYDPYD